MNSVYALFNNKDLARRALARLREESPRLGVDPKTIVTISSEPLEEAGFGWKEQSTRLPWIATCGGVLGGTVGYALASFTQRSYPLPTGGMPIVAMWPTGIIMYELTMLGVIITTIVTFLIGVRLPSWKTRVNDPEVAQGKILVGVTNADPGIRSEISRRLYDAGAERVSEAPNG